jgi:hypothetical protein
MKRALVFLLLAIGCSSSSTGAPGGGDGGGTSSGGSSGVGPDGKALPRVVIESQISPGTHSAAECGETGTFLTIGGFEQPTTSIYDGETFAGAAVTVACSVVQEGDVFRVEGLTTLGSSGSFTVSGHFRPAGDQNGISSTTANAKSGAFGQGDCVAHYTQPLQSTASGRVWAELDCPNATNANTQKTCRVVTQFRFENCKQE